MLKIQKVILKYDLNYSLDEEEKKFISLIDQEDLVRVRKSIIDSVRTHELPIDVLEEMLENMKEEEYNKYANGILKTDDLKQKKIELEKKIYELIFDISKMNINYFNNFEDKQGNIPHR